MPSAPPHQPHPPVAPQLPPYSWTTLHPEAQLLYLQSVPEADDAISLLLNTTVLGFDLEWKPVFRKDQPDNPVALVQLATSHHILLIQLTYMREFPKKLKQLLENPDILKAGVGIQKDATKLFRDWNVGTRGCVDLALLARTVDNAEWKGRYTQPIGLARLVQTYQSLAMSKGKVRRSNWERRLSAIQQEYAGNDAHAGFVIYMKLEQMMKKMATVPRSEYYMFDCIGGVLSLPSGDPWSPHNPDYDPGPPPPPRPPRKEKEGPNADAAQADSSAQPDSTTSLPAQNGETELKVPECLADEPNSVAQQNVPSSDKGEASAEHVGDPSSMPLMVSSPDGSLGASTHRSRAALGRGRGPHQGGASSAPLIPSSSGSVVGGSAHHSRAAFGRFPRGRGSHKVEVSDSSVNEAPPRRGRYRWGRAYRGRGSTAEKQS